MDRKERQERIEAFLRNELSTEERERFQQEMDADRELSADVNLHRVMIEEFGDLEKQEWIKKLDIQSDYFFGDRPLGRKKWWYWIIGLAGLSGVLLIVWVFSPFFFNPPVEVPADTEVIEPTEESTTPESLLPENQETETPSVEGTEPDDRPSRPIAQLDPADMVPNPYFENLIRSDFRGNELRFSGINVRFSEGQFMINGNIQKLSTEEGTLVLFVYSNKEQDYLDGNFLLSSPLSLQPVITDEITRTANGEALQTFRFSAVETANWNAGLYYYFLAWERDEEPLYTGKIEVN